MILPTGGGAAPRACGPGWCTHYCSALHRGLAGDSSTLNSLDLHFYSFSGPYIDSYAAVRFTGAFVDRLLRGSQAAQQRSGKPSCSPCRLGRAGGRGSPPGDGSGGISG